jgi:hypothetical protein
VPALLAGILLVQVSTVIVGLWSTPDVSIAPVTWEYKIESVPDLLFTETMDSYGTGGWELVIARRAQNPITDDFSYECIFKRVAQVDE